jgi:hypothetical protein
MSTNDESPLSMFSSEAKKSKKTTAEKVNIPETLNNNRETKRKVEEMRDRMSGMKQALDDKIEQFSRKKGVSKDQIWEYIHNSQNFSPEEWDVIRNKGKELVNKVWEIVDNGTTTGYTNRDTSVRKGKYIGTRRNWIPTK